MSSSSLILCLKSTFRLTFEIKQLSRIWTLRKLTWLLGKALYSYITADEISTHLHRFNSSNWFWEHSTTLLELIIGSGCTVSSQRSITSGRSYPREVAHHCWLMIWISFVYSRAWRGTQWAAEITVYRWHQENGRVKEWPSMSREK